MSSPDFGPRSTVDDCDRRPETVDSHMMAAPCVACAASATASENVGCAWIVLISSSAVHSSRRASTASATSSVDRGPIMCTPSTSSVLLVGDDLDEPFGLARHLGAPEDAERKRSDAHVVPPLLRLGFREADAADFRVAVGASRHVVVVQRLDVLSGQPLGHNDAFRRRDVRQLRVAGRPPSVMTSPMAEMCGTDVRYSASTLM